MNLTEDELELAAIDWFRELGYAFAHGPDIAPEEPAAERDSFQDVVLRERLRDALTRLNPDLPAEALDDAFRQITVPSGPSLITNNRAFHEMLVNGVSVQYQREDGSTTGAQAQLVDFEDAEPNDWLVVNQFTVIENKVNRRPDVVVFVNGLPLAVLELKNPADAKATIWSAYNQLETYKQQIPSLFAYNESLIISDGLEARIGTLSSNKEWFLPWRTIEGEQLAPKDKLQLEVMMKGVFEKQRFLKYLRHFITFDDDGHKVTKIAAGYHQFHAVERAVDATLTATSAEGDRRAGVVWHTQGSGKSLTMAFYAGRAVLHEQMENPTLLVITDRNDLDDQLFGTFSRCRDILRQTPSQAESRTDLRELLEVASGGVVFTTVQKFFPEEKGDTYPLLSDRRNIVVIADEAHRSQYDFIDGFARHMRDALPNASFIGFTGTPIELADKNTQAVFGDYVSIYDIQQAVEDGATVPIYYDSRLARIELNDAEKPHIDPDFEEATEGEEAEGKEKLKRKWAAMEALVGAEKRIGLIAQDLVDHYEDRCSAMDGKAMIVCMSRRICVDLYDALVKIRPDWHDEADAKGAIKVVMTGSASDPTDWQQHIRNKRGREAIASRFKDPEDPLKIVLVRDMWLTGFDVPCLHTMYVDKPMRGHGLMQAIARVNRVFRDKPGGLVVDYLGLADQLKKALADYTDSGGKGKTAVDQNEAAAIMQEKYEICRGILHGFDWTDWTEGGPADRLGLIPTAYEHVVSQHDGKKRFVAAVTALSKAFALAVPHDEAIKIRDDVAFFQAVRAALVKTDTNNPAGGEDMELAIRQIVSKAVTPDGVVDIFDAAGLDKPDISILSDEFLAEVKGLPHKNLAVDLLQKLLNDEIRERSRKNVVQARAFSEMLEDAIRAYQNRAIEAAQVIEKLIEIAKEMREAHERGEKLGLNDDEVAFYDALETNDSAVAVLGDDQLKLIARELVESVRKNVTIDWTSRESVRAKLRLAVKRVLRKHGYPPDKQEKATQTVLEQAEGLAYDWAA